MTLPPLLALLSDDLSCQAPNGCRYRAKYKTIPDGTLLCGVHSRNRSRLALPIYLDTSIEHRRRVNSGAYLRREAGEAGLVALRTNNRWQYNPHLDDSVGIRIRRAAAEEGTPVFGELAFGQVGPVHLRDYVSPSVAHLLELCGLYNFDFGDKIREEFWQQLRRGFEQRMPPSRLRFSERQLMRKYDIDAESPKLYVNLTGSGNQLMTPLQFRALVCRIYEKLIENHPVVEALRKARADGFDLVIWTPKPVFHHSTVRELCAEFLVEWQPFTEEDILACMLVIDDAGDYPWNVYIRRNEEIFA